MIRPGPLEDFAKVFAPCGFKEDAFLACYGMAECSLAVSFAALDRALELDYVNGNCLARDRKAVPVDISQEKDDATRVKLPCGIHKGGLCRIDIVEPSLCGDPAS
jgi:fatty-acyl-CoA synthase